MPLTISQKADFLIAEFDTELTIFNVREAHAVLAPALASLDGRLIIDVATLTDIDTAGLQLLLWSLQQINTPAEAIVTSNEDCAFHHISQSYGLQWPTEFQRGKH